MKPSATVVTQGYQPVIIHTDGTKEIVWGPPLVSRETAKKYARLEINARQNARMGG